ncbi:MAG: M18 family aminopeptidase, partial [Nitrospinaceae bacterium]|nr:M18 family aminopeptidase [Nitrospinaceae bacterium]NIT84983.1 M18 family aminopeptidase [Nitrospinaceae bacterium]NIU99362.1 M18 family aminopeptidase [Nitrospinaceae bacterium]NIY18482.1 M18 family aminopeptidase [Nitrospinaceae bacterium]
MILRDGKGTTTRLVRFADPLLRIPQLAIHLNREVNQKGLILNPQTHLPPILSLVEGDLQCESYLKEMVARQLDCRPEDLLGLELSLYDVQKSSLAGPNSEFLFAPRLDNLASCHAATQGLLEARERAPETR